MAGCLPQLHGCPGLSIMPVQEEGANDRQVTNHKTQQLSRNVTFPSITKKVPVLSRFTWDTYLSVSFCKPSLLDLRNVAPRTDLTDGDLSDLQTREDFTSAFSGIMSKAKH